MSKINSHKIGKETNINIGKISQKIKNTYFSTSNIIFSSNFIHHNAKLKDIYSLEKDKKKFLNLTNFINKNNNKLNYIKDKNISLFKNRKNLFGRPISYKKMYSKNFNSKSIIRMKNNNKNIKNIYISKKNIFLNDLQKSKIINFNNKNKTDFSGKKKTATISNKFQIINNNFFQNYIHQRNTELEKFYKKNNIKKSNKNSNKLKVKNDFQKKIFIKKIEKKEKSRNFNLKKDLLNIRSFIVSTKEKRDSKKIQKQNNDTNIIKKNIFFKFQTNSRTNELKENESKFLNYELANSDSELALTNFLNNNNINININNQEIIENESPIEELERKANEIYNSGFRKKNIPYIRVLSKDLDLNNEIEELKDGEGIQNILTLSVNLNYCKKKI